MNTDALASLSYGVYAVTVNDKANGRPTGCIANSTMQVTAVPNALLVSLSHDNHTNRCVAAEKRFALSVFGEYTDAELIRTFGFSSGKSTAKFDGLDYQTKEGLPIIPGACAYFVCEVTDVFETATHTLFLATVKDMDVLNKDKPMTYAYYRNVIKGKTAANAPTYLKERDGATDSAAARTDAIYKCSVCGHVYGGEAPFDELPSSFECPVCGAPKRKFKKQ